MLLAKIFSKRNTIPECIDEKSCTLGCTESCFENSHDWKNDNCYWDHWDNLP
jgi:hypothetical protein